MTYFNFIGIYDDVLTKEECDIIIDEFENNTDRQIVGTSGGGKIKPNVKKSTDIGYHVTDDSKTTKIIPYSLEKYLNQYREEYPDVDRLCEWEFYEVYNVQRYKPNEGFYKPHCEVTGFNQNRVLVWMYYLNDLDNGGTKFTSYNTIIHAKRGRLVIWPAYWTHTHCGVISNTQTKYIATGWYEFKKY
tara:strand:+ start:1286 stop:1849 length:564 start_codon:yes stop_codon:yes gene_type:complete